MRLRVPPKVDVAVAAAFVLLVVLEALFSSAVRSPVLHLTVAGVAMAALAWRRVMPVPVAALVMAANIVVNPEGQFSTVLALVLVCYSCGAELDPPWSRVGLAVVAAPFLVVLSLEGIEPSDVAAALVFLVGPWTVGVAMRRRAGRVADAEERARRLERERDEHRAAAAAEERTRIARELHDIVSHSLTVITIQTQAVRRRLGPDHLPESDDLAAVEATAREALDEMRRLFGILRREGEGVSLSPQPGLEELERLCDQVRAAGLEVEVQVEGDPRPLPAGVDLAAFRIVQEGLTNAVRHSGARRATVCLSYDDRRLQLAVEDDGCGLDPAALGTQGHGLIGIRERVALYGGSVDVRAGAGRGTRLVATLPNALTRTAAPGA